MSQVFSATSRKVSSASFPFAKGLPAPKAAIRGPGERLRLWSDRAGLGSLQGIAHRFRMQGSWPRRGQPGNDAMNNRNARRLLLVVVPLFVTTPAVLARLKPITVDLSQYSDPNGSHRSLGKESADLEGSMADRLRQLREGREIQQIAQRLLQNPHFLTDIQNKVSRAEAEKLLDRLKKGEGIGGDPIWKGILDQAGKHVSEEEAEKIQRWVKSQPPVPMTQPSDPGQPPPSPTGIKPPEMMPSVQPPSPVKPASPWADLKDKSTSWLKDRMTDFPEDIADLLDNVGEGALGESVREALRSLGRGGMDGEGLPFNLQEVFRDLGGQLSTLGEHLPSDPVPWQEIGSLFRDFHGPSLPSFEGPAASGGKVSPGGDGFGLVWLWLAVLAVFAFILYRSVERRRSGGGEAGWRLGPWPVAPGSVATRADLVAAFEYLAFLCLGPSARTCNHLDVADCLGEQSSDAERRRAAGELARLYEQARYAPGDEALTETDLAAARRDLCLLAGVATA
jgi:hypothetical protein